MGWGLKVNKCRIKVVERLMMVSVGGGNELGTEGQYVWAEGSEAEVGEGRQQ